ncbi:unnamed protein product [Thlaspi arvense]|uniref:AB hydrolase-1 domain-containing protein n=1 Tax=Thlaspi arvense TaxID=13288 RepID=A0AAU9SP52_THLAR|nr:unnamed protein product [Thlaspi arvense]
MRRTAMSEYTDFEYTISTRRNSSTSLPFAELTCTEVRRRKLRSPNGETTSSPSLPDKSIVRHSGFIPLHKADSNVAFEISRGHNGATAISRPSNHPTYKYSLDCAEVILLVLRRFGLTTYGSVTILREIDMAIESSPSLSRGEGEINIKIWKIITKIYRTDCLRTEEYRSGPASLEVNHFTFHCFVLTMSTSLHHCHTLLTSCKNLRALTQIHASFVKSGVDTDPYFTGKLILQCAISIPGALPYARRLLLCFPYPDAFMFNTLVRGYSESDEPHSSVAAFVEMTRKGLVFPDSFSFAFVVKAAANFRSLRTGFQVHCQALKHGLDSHLFVATTLIGLYGECERVELARKVFDEMRQPNVVAWNAVVTACFRGNDVSGAREIFDKMSERNHMSWNKSNWQWKFKGNSIGIYYEQHEREKCESAKNILMIPTISDVSTVEEWRSVAKDIVQRDGDVNWRTTIVDWPGLGYSDRPKMDYNTDVMEKFVVDFMNSPESPMSQSGNNDLVIIGGGHAATLAIRAACRGLLKPSAIAAVAPTWAGPLPIVFGRDSSMETRYGLLRGTLRAPGVGWMMYNMLVSNEKSIESQYKSHVYADQTNVTEAIIQSRYELTNRKGSRYVPAAFLTGLLDPVSSRDEFLQLFADLEGKIPVMVMSTKGAPKRSKAEMEALRGAKGVSKFVEVEGALLPQEEYPSLVAQELYNFLQETFASPN